MLIRQLKLFVFVSMASIFSLSGQEEGEGDGGGGNTAPNGVVYTNTCINNNPNGVDWDVWFNDPNGDCISADWFARYYTPQGTVDKTSAQWQAAGNDPTIDFNNWDCCSITGGSGGCDCFWTYSEEEETLSIDCSCEED